MQNTAEQLVTQPDQEFDHERRYANDTVTWLAETLYGSMYTSFDFYYDGVDLRSEDGGSMDDVFDDAIEAAKIIAYENPSLLFELRRRLIEREELDEIKAMAAGELFNEDGEQVNTIVVISDYPPELMGSSEDLGGYNGKRKQTMARIITKAEDGIISIATQSWDGSNPQAIDAVYGKLGVTPEAGEKLGQRVKLQMPSKWQPQLMGNLTKAYDQSLTEQHGGSWHVGIKQPDDRAVVNTYEFAKNQTDLIEWFVELKKIDSTLAGSLRYNVAATAKARYEEYLGAIGSLSRSDIKLGLVKPEALISFQRIVAARPSIEQELHREGRRAAARGEVFSGCGETVKAETAEESAEAEASALGYGNKSTHTSDEECVFVSKKCPKCDKKNVVTTVTSTHIRGSCGCVEKVKKQERV
jgi:phage FluMu protein Com